MNSLLRIKNLHKVYKTDVGTIHALKGVSLDIEQGEIFGLLGVNGAGKQPFLVLLQQSTHQQAARFCTRTHLSMVQ